jgi:hypothetical protein
VLYWIQFTQIEKYTTSYGNIFPIYQYDVFDTKLNPTQLEISGWKILYFDPKNKSTASKSYCKIIDKYGNLKTLYEVLVKEKRENLNKETEVYYSNYNLWEEVGISRVLHFVVEICIQFDRWTNYEIFEENLNIKKKLQSLNQENKQYKLLIAKVEAIFGQEFKSILLQEGQEIANNDKIIELLLEQQGQKHSKIMEMLNDFKNLRGRES